MNTDPSFETPPNSALPAADWQVLDTAFSQVQYKMTQNWIPFDPAVHAQMSHLPIRRPILAKTVELAGYAYVDPFDWLASPAHGFLRVGAAVMVDDQAWDSFHGSWRLAKPYVGMRVTAKMDPIRRMLLTATKTGPAVPDKWNCRHRRVEGESKCSVCAAFGRLVKT